jgi:hypothetical protein
MTLFAQSTLGEHRSYPLSPPLSVLPGDLLTTDGRHVYLIRAGVVIETREISGSGVPVGATPVAAAETLSSVVFFRSTPVPGTSATLVDVNVAANGDRTYEFGDGTGQTMPEIAVAELADSVDATNDLAKKLLIAISHRRSPDGANVSNQVGATITIDCNAASPVQFSLID